MNNQELLQNISDKGTIQNHLTFMALYIALYENFTATFIDNVKSFLCDLSIEDGEPHYSETSSYRNKIKNRVVDQKGNKDVLKATMLWLQDMEAMSAQDYADFLEIKSIRNIYAHEMSRLIIEGVPPNDARWFFKLLNLYRKLDKWWINEIEIPISGIFQSETYDEDGVENLKLLTFELVIASLYHNEEKAIKSDGEKHETSI